MEKAIGKRYSFMELLKSHDYSIEIPIIQRDYAQGRNSQKEVRDNFLDALKIYLRDGLPNRDLDFVYGYSYKEIDGNKFVPLDGQQRLTTLFLLHWYLANISDNLDVLRGSLYRNNASRFSYKTRSTSAEFCDALISNEIVVTELISADNRDMSNSFSNTIKNKSWYFNAWNNDPTVQSMLVMLDAIHLEFKECADFFDKLIDENTPIITFLYLDLQTLQQNDDLYIKMNSRGKPLTDFENFKAKFEQLISFSFAKDNVQYKLLMDGKEIPVKLKQYFSFKIDTVWSNLFWNYRSLVATNPNSYDDEMLNFIRVVVSNKYAVSNGKELENIDLLFKNSTISFQKYSRMNVLTNEAILSLVKSFDSLTNGNKRLKKLLANDFYFDEEEVFKKVLTNSLSYPERALFYAYVEYLNAYPKKAEGLQSWMRVVHNLVENTRIDGVDLGINALRAINNMLPFADDIVAYLVGDNCKIDFFSSGQVKEEKIKARLIKKSQTWQDLIVLYESQIFHKGQIAYLLEFAGVLSEWDANNTFEWTAAEEESLINNFKRYKEKSVYVFSVLAGQQNEEYYLERALLTKGSYLLPSPNSKYNFSSAKGLQNYERDFSWKRMLRIDSTDEAADNGVTFLDRRMYLKELLDDKRITHTNAQDDLKNIIRDGAEDWRSSFITEPRLIQYCKKGFIHAQSFSNIKLLNASQINHLWSDMTTYNLALELADAQSKFKPFESVWNFDGRGIFDRSFCRLYDWTYKKIQYVFEIEYSFDSNSQNGKYRLIFKKLKGDSKLDSYNNQLVDIVQEQKLKWNDTNRHFAFESRSKDSIKKSLYKLCDAFVELKK
ncbi:DUF262 domain-containing protein [Taibaiella chishuiensis]|uniref:Uncharacterized protein DUF262 n=1 Tax=Taibaiella chishuiensis TaxID=1434707 RepID=A0A2P8CX61_9BACT|nr:DUF262 domain-containing protein [Taibaiella chishuiensis]PSK89571.1 uncharacterized protein DUF262 [Taibaiella chishuiensis]